MFKLLSNKNKYKPLRRQSMFVKPLKEINYLFKTTIWLSKLQDTCKKNTFEQLHRVRSHTTEFLQHTFFNDT